LGGLVVGNGICFFINNNAVGQRIMAQRKVFYGWFIVAASIVGIGSSFSLLVASMTGIFAEPLIKEFGWSATQIFNGSFWAGILSAASAPVIGAISDRVGVRRVLAVSFLFEIVLLYSFSLMNGSHSGYQGYLIRYSLLAILCMGTTQVVFSRVLASWFHRRLGMALGIALAGVGLGGAFWSKVIQALINIYGWRGAYVGMALIIAFITLPIVLLVIRESPKVMGLSVDGDDRLSVQAFHDRRQDAGTSLSDAARDPQYWLMIVVFLLTGLAIQGVSINMVPLMKSLGMGANLAASVQASMFIAVVAGRFTSGMLLDKVFGPRIAQAFLLAPIIGIVALLSGASGPWAFASAMCVGLALGGESDVFAYLVKRYFGIKYYSRIYGTLFSTFGIASAIASVGTAWGSEHIQGGYGRVLWVHVTLLVAALLILFLFGKYADEELAH
jgi:OFA family oxalate/formate antiporter-like MFS transporter